MAEEIEKLKNKVEVFGFHISRVPRPTFLKFKELADREFCGDYGLTLKWLVDGVDENAEVLAALTNLEERLSKLEQKTEYSGPAQIKLGTGKVLNEKKEE